ncbi:hypothetical protein GGQ73_000389 [Rhizobium skierniewicense]|uniref:Uncharacterized protein n=1 Tax=Rhizobium skierniewicense TaxID=984260 RepID=A0A7W6G1F7_9HYPH|nr:DUF6880 family protein [Rhizobium skierniewicense]MBB3944466.1 hypothetical protein [Rhizobium skierniewicense]
MAAKTTLNAKNLEVLGAQRLAELLIEISTGSAAHKRRLRMEIAGSHSSADVSREVRKRLSTIMRARTFIDWRKVKAMKMDLETQRKTIVDAVAPHDPAEAFELIWQFLAVADPLFGRSDDGSGLLIQSFHQACHDAGAIAKAANIDIDVLSEKIFTALQDNGYGQFDRLITAMIPALENEGLTRLRALFVTWSKEPKEKARKTDRTVIGWSSAGAIYEDEVYGNHKDLTIRIALQEIADALGDVDAYIAQQPEKTRATPMVAADIANRLVSAGRAEEALEVLDKVETNRRTDVPFEWELARIQALDALGRGQEAQAFRWRCFEQSLNDEHLRAYVKRLPDFDDIEAEAKAFGYAQAFPNVHRALHFFLRWPSPAEAAKLVMKREAELDGDLYGLMTPVADALSAKQPLAATVVLRSMIDFTLRNGRSSRYKHAARHLAECGSLASQIEDFGSRQSHDAYVADLKREYGRKSGFWSQVQSS